MSNPPPAKQRKLVGESDDDLQFQFETDGESEADSYLHLVCYEHTEESFHGLVTGDGRTFLPSSKIVKQTRRGQVKITKKAASLSRVWQAALDRWMSPDENAEFEVPEVGRVVLEKVSLIIQYVNSIPIRNFEISPKILLILVET
jgi:hypothetical protein